MAQRYDIRERSREIDPRIRAINEETDRQLAKLGGKFVLVTTTHDMTAEEEEMALFEGFLREGHPVEVAARKAKEFLVLRDHIFQDNNKRGNAKKKGQDGQ